MQGLVLGGSKDEAAIRTEGAAAHLVSETPIGIEGEAPHTSKPVVGAGEGAPQFPPRTVQWVKHGVPTAIVPGGRDSQSPVRAERAARDRTWVARVGSHSLPVRDVPNSQCL